MKISNEDKQCIIPTEHRFTFEVCSVVLCFAVSPHVVGLLL